MLLVRGTFYDGLKCHFDFNAVGKLMELHGEGGGRTAAKATDDTGAKVEQADGYELPIQETV